MKKNKLTVNSKRKAAPLLPSLDNACGSPVSISTRVSGGKNAGPASDVAAEKAPATVGTVVGFLLKLHRQKHQSADDLNKLRQMIVDTPESWHLVNGIGDRARQSILEKLYSGTLRACVLAEMDIFKQEMGYVNAPALERMHIDHVLTAWLRLRDAEIQFSHCMSGESIGTATARFRQEILESAQSRFLRAGEALARIRRLTRNTPALQINIASNGGKQVNLQGH